MVLKPMLRRTFGLALAACLFVGAAAQASDIRVVSSGGFAAALKELAPEFEHATGNKLILGWGPVDGQKRKMLCPSGSRAASRSTC